MTDSEYLIMLRRLSTRGKIRGADTVYADASALIDLPGLPLSTVDGGDGQPRRSPRLLRVAVVVLALGLAGFGLIVATRSQSGDDVGVGGVGNESTVDSRTEQLSQWLADYDPNEVAYLRETADPAFGELSDELMISMLEFRRSCRLLNAALGEAQAATDPTLRIQAVDAILQPQIERVRERGVNGDQTVALLGTFAAELGEAHYASVEAFVAGSDCARSIAFPTVDR